MPMGGDPYGAPPPAGGGMGGSPYGAPPGMQPQGGMGMGGPPPQDFGGQVNQGFQQMGQAFNQGMQPYQGGNPMMGQPGMPGALGTMGQGPPKQFMTTLLLAVFAGCFGIHRFYTGHTLIGIIQLCTGGGCGFFAIYDIIMIATGKYTDSQGRPLVK
jgi:hypothetical protein